MYHTKRTIAQHILPMEKPVLTWQLAPTWILTVLAEKYLVMVWKQSINIYQGP